MARLARVGSYLKRNKDLVKNVGMGSALSAGFGMMGGGPAAGLAYGLGDFAVALPLTAAARKISPPKKRRVEVSPGKFEEELVPSSLEGAANIGGSVVSPMATQALIGGMMPRAGVVPTQESQEQQLMQQMMQRQAVNNLQVPQSVAPGTQFQSQGIEQTFLDEYRQQVTKMLPNLPPGYLEEIIAMGGMV
jgi:hypothetical protein